MTGPKLFNVRREPDAWFAEFWTLYPRREAKQDALKAMAELRPDEAMKEAIRQALAWQVHKEQWLRGIIPLPASWLRGRRWEDEPMRRLLTPAAQAVANRQSDEIRQQMEWRSLTAEEKRKKLAEVH